MRINAVLCMAFLALTAAPLAADEPVTLENVIDPGPNVLDEPAAGEFSLEKAVRFLDSASLTWQKERKCFTCHTNYAYLYARPLVDADAPAHREVRGFAEELVGSRWPEKGPRWDAEVVATAAALAFNDAATTGRLHPLTRTALEKMWTVQRPDGGWDWIKCGWPPMESDDHYGVTLAAIAVGAAPEDYAQTEAAREGIAGIRRYFKENPPSTLHHEAMLLWASSSLDGLMREEQQELCVKKLLSLQREDGGWCLATLGDWKRGDGSKQDATTSDGYATGFVVYVLRKSGVAKSEAAIQRALAWLKANQRTSGRWMTRSLNTDGRHYISHAGTAFAVMALAEP